MSQRTVLVAEDDPLIRLVLVEALMEEDYFVVQAGNVLEAVAAIGSNPKFDAVITDVDMPGALNGLDLAAMVSSVTPLTTIVVQSGRDVTDDIRPDWTFMRKPYSLNRLLTLLESRLESSFLCPVLAEAV